MPSMTKDQAAIGASKGVSVTDVLGCQWRDANSQPPAVPHHHHHQHNYDHHQLLPQQQDGAAPPFLTPGTSDLPSGLSHLMAIVADPGPARLASGGPQALVGSSLLGTPADTACLVDSSLSGGQHLLGVHDGGDYWQAGGHRQGSTRADQRCSSDQPEAPAGSSSATSSTDSSSIAQQPTASPSGGTTRIAEDRAAACVETRAQTVRGGEAASGVQAPVTASSADGCHLIQGGGLACRGEEERRLTLGPASGSGRHVAVSPSERSHRQATCRSGRAARVDTLATSSSAAAGPFHYSPSGTQPQGNSECLPAELQRAVSAGWISVQDAQGIAQVLAGMSHEEQRQLAAPASDSQSGATTEMEGPVPSRKRGGAQLLGQCGAGSSLEGLLRVDSASGVTGVEAAALPLACSPGSLTSALPYSGAKMRSTAGGGSLCAP